MNAQKFTEPGKKIPFAIRFIIPLPDVQTGQSKVMFVPEFSGVVTNYEIYDQTMICPRIWIEPVEIDGMIANFKVEVWGMQKGEKKRLTEEWFFSHVPLDLTPQDFINQHMNHQHDETMKLYRQRLAEHPKPFFKTVKGETLKQIDPWENAKHATLSLLKEEYPSLANALKRGKPSPEQVKAFVADCFRIHGHPTSNFDFNQAQDDIKFWADIGEALQQRANREKRKTKVDALDWYLANPKNWIKLHALPLDEISRLANAATDFDLSNGAIEKRLERLELITARKRGPRRQ